MEIRTKEEIERENTLLRHKYKTLKLKYDMVNNALKKLNLLTESELSDFNSRTNALTKAMKIGGEKYGHN